MTVHFALFFRTANQSSVGEITLQGKITSLDISQGKSHHEDQLLLYVRA